MQPSSKSGAVIVNDRTNPGEAEPEFVDYPLPVSNLRTWEEVISKLKKTPASDQELSEKKDSQPPKLAVMASCGSYNPIHSAHIEMFEAAKSKLETEDRVVILGGFMSPVNDAYGKPGLLNFETRKEICDLALKGHEWLAPEPWEGHQKKYQRSYVVLSHIVNAVRDHYSSTARTEEERELANDIQIYFVCGGDLFETFYRPRVWKLTLLEKIFSEFYLCVIARVAAEDPIEVMKNRSAEPLTSPDEPGVTVDLSKYTHKVAVTSIKPNRSSSTLVRETLLAGYEKFGDDIDAVEKHVQADLKEILPEPCISYLVRNKLYSQ